MIVLVMGVAGVGKTTIGEALARALGARFIDADDYHPPRKRREDEGRHSAAGQRSLALAAASQ